jgi:superfamily II DNA/RNA helicase
MPYQSNYYSSRRPKNGSRSGTSRNRFGGTSRQTQGRRGPKKDYIDPARFVKVARVVEEDMYTPQHTFNDFIINETIKRNLQQKGYTQPSPIQDKTIPFALEGRDVIGVAHTGTGKTAAFGIPLVHAVLENRIKALVVAPTRELAQQINEELLSLAKGSAIKSVVLIGGAGMGHQLRELRNSPQIVVGTPGRIKDHIERGSLKLQAFRFVVLDEVDRMLDMGFVHDVTKILSHVSSERQSMFFSATLDTRVNTLIETFAKEPITISIKSGDTSDAIHQDVVFVEHDNQKIDKLHDLLLADGTSKVIIFDDTQRSVEKLSTELIGRGFKSDAIHGGKSQGQRQRSLRRFKQNEVTVLVATDVAARGIDVSDITHVINYSTPNTYADYVHRIGRAGRAGNIGYAYTFVNK